MLHTSFLKTATLLLAAVGGVIAAPSSGPHKRAKSPITHLGNQGPILCEFLSF